LHRILMTGGRFLAKGHEVHTCYAVHCADAAHAYDQKSASPGLPGNIHDKASLCASGFHN